MSNREWPYTFEKRDEPEKPKKKSQPKPVKEETPKLATVNQKPQINKIYEKGSAGQALFGFLSSWSKGEWDEMENFSQLSIVAANLNYAMFFESRFRDRLKSFEIIGIDYPIGQPVIAVGRVRLVIKGEEKEVDIRLVREDPKRRVPSTSGIWGVNYSSFSI